MREPLSIAGLRDLESLFETPRPRPVLRLVPAVEVKPETFTGSKYDRNLGTTEIAARIRADIKAAVKAGELPRGKYSVTKQCYSGGSSITINLSEFEGLSLHSEEWVRFCADRTPGKDWYDTHKACDRWTPEARALRERVEGMARAYLRDSSDSRTDYFNCNFYLHVNLRD